MKKRLIAMLLAGAMCASIAGCSSNGGDDQSTPSGGETSGEAKYNVSVILKTTAAEYWKFVQSGAEAYAEEHRIRSRSMSRVLRLRLPSRSSST